MKRLVTYLCIFGILCLISSISGICAVTVSNNGHWVSYYHGYLPRGCVALIGCILLYLAWAIYQRRSHAWWLGVLGQVAVWINFVIAGTLATASQYPHQSARDTLLFGAMLAIMSLPVFIYWMLRWRKQKTYFDSESDDAT
jgi:Transmembrane region of lysyl-tRNA synthetase